MKKIITLFYIISFVAIANAQIEFAPVGAEWNYSHKDTLSGYTYKYQNMNYISEKDTMVLGNNCKLINGGGLIELSGYPPTSVHFSEIIYQDNSTIYYYFQEQFRKIFDFSLELGDSIDIEFKTNKVNSFNYDSTIVIRCIVDGITLDTINGSEIKTFSVIPHNFSLYHPNIMLTDLKSHYFFNERYLHNAITSIESFIPNTTTNGTLCEPPLIFNLTCYNENNFSYTTDWWLEEDKHCDFSGTIYVENIENKEIKFFPNPVIDNITIQNNENDINLVEIVDLLGKVHVSLSIESNSDICINLSNLQKGVYFLKMSYNKNNSITKKIIKL